MILTRQKIFQVCRYPAILHTASQKKMSIASAYALHGGAGMLVSASTKIKVTVTMPTHDPSQYLCRHP